MKTRKWPVVLGLVAVLGGVPWVLAQGRLCGKIGALVEYDVKKGQTIESAVTKTGRVTIRRNEKILGDLRTGMEVMADDEVRWDVGIGFSVEFGNGSTQVYGPSKKPAVARVVCPGTEARVDLTGVVGTVHSFVRAGSSLTLSSDRMVTAGTRQTAFAVLIDSVNQHVVVRVWDGEVRVSHKAGEIAVKEMDEVRVSYVGDVVRSKISVQELLTARRVLLERSKVFGIAGRPEVEAGLKVIEKELVERGGSGIERLEPRATQYIVQPGDTLESIVRKTYPTAGEREAIEAVSEGIIRNNPGVTSPAGIEHGQKLDLPVVPRVRK